MPDRWIPQYTMVAFTRIPYDDVVRRAARQDRILDAGMLALGCAAAVAVAAFAVKRGAAAQIFAWLRGLAHRA